MAKVEANKIPIKTETHTPFVPTPSYRRIQPKVEAHVPVVSTANDRVQNLTHEVIPIPLVDSEDSDLIEDKALKQEISNTLVHEAAKALYTSSILPTSIEINLIKYDVTLKLVQGPKVMINIAACRRGEKVAEVSLN